VDHLTVARAESSAIELRAVRLFGGGCCEAMSQRKIHVSGAFRRTPGIASAVHRTPSAFAWASDAVAEPTPGQTIAEFKDAVVASLAAQGDKMGRYTKSLKG
jgi:hypothetical protein